MIIIALVGAFILGLGVGLYICIQTEVEKLVKQAAKEATHGYLEKKSTEQHAEPTPPRV